MHPGEYLLAAEGPIRANAEKEAVRVMVQNSGDRPIQVGSHFHFFETNRALRFNRAKAYGMHLNIPAGTAVRFEPGEEKEVERTGFGGHRVIHGFCGLTSGALDAPGRRERALEHAAHEGFQSSE